MKPWLIIILGFGILLRVIGFGTYPEGLHADEAMFGYHAYSLLKTGSDAHGIRFPLSVRLFGIPSGAIYGYAATPFIATLGLTDVAVRLPSLVAGILLIPLIYLIAIWIFGSKNIALAASAVTAINPSAVFLSRVQSDPLLAVFLIYVGLIGFMQYMKRRRWMLFCSSILAFSLSFFSHQAAILGVIPALLFPIWIFYGSERMKRIRFQSVVLVLVVFLIGIIAGITVRDRGLALSPAQDQGAAISLIHSITEDGMAGVPVFITRSFHNRVIEALRIVLVNAYRYWSGEFLTIGPVQPLRESVPGIGFLHLYEYPLFLLGIVFGLYHYRKQTIGILMWLITGTLLISFAVQETPNVHRFFYFWLPMSSLIALGATALFRYLRQLGVKNGGVIGIYLFTVIISVMYWAHQFFIHQPYHEPYHRNYATRELVKELAERKSEYRQAVITTSAGEVEVFLLYYMGFDPKRYQTLYAADGLKGMEKEGYIYSSDRCPSQNITYRDIRYEDTLFVDGNGCPDAPGMEHIHTVRWRDTMEAFRLVKYINDEENTL